VRCSEYESFSKVMRRQFHGVVATLFSCSRRTLSRILMACFHFMIIRGLLDLIYINFSSPPDEIPGLRQYIRDRTSWLHKTSSKNNNSFDQFSQVAPNSTQNSFVKTSSKNMSSTTSGVVTPATYRHSPPSDSVLSNTDRNSGRLGTVDLSATVPASSLSHHNVEPEPTNASASNPQPFSFNSSEICEGDYNFQYNIDFVRGDLRMGTFNISPGTPNACCLQCEMLAACTHWTWADNLCWLKNPPLAAKPKARNQQRLPAPPPQRDEYNMAC
jgi:hypothetical protein